VPGRSRSIAPASRPRNSPSLPKTAGLVDVSDEELKEASRLTAIAVTTYITCTESTFRRFRCCP
jgi:hypothetical protein